VGMYPSPPMDFGFYARAQHARAQERSLSTTCLSPDNAPKLISHL